MATCPPRRVFESRLKKGLRVKFWPKSLRMRLILSVTFAMVVTHLLVLLAIAEVFGREQRLDRAQQMARLVAFIKPRIEAQTDIPLDQPL